MSAEVHDQDCALALVTVVRWMRQLDLSEIIVGQDEHGPYVQVLSKPIDACPDVYVVQCRMNRRLRDECES